MRLTTQRTADYNSLATGKVNRLPRVGDRVVCVHGEGTLLEASDDGCTI